MLELWERQSIHSLLLLPDPLRPGVITPNWVLWLSSQEMDMATRVQSWMRLIAFLIALIPLGKV